MSNRCEKCDEVLKKGEVDMCEDCKRKRREEEDYSYRHKHDDDFGMPGDMMNTGIPGGIDGNFGTPW